MKEQGNKNNIVINIPQMQFAFSNENSIDFHGDRISSLDAADIIRTTFDDGEIEMREAFVVLFFNEANVPIGTYKHSAGGRDSTLVDLGLVLGAALTSLSSGMILAHNHPVGISNPSEADLAITLQFIEAAKFHNLTIIDHIVVTKDSHTSMAEHEMINLSNPYPLTPPKGALDVEFDLGDVEYILDFDPEDDE